MGRDPNPLALESPAMSAPTDDPSDFQLTRLLRHSLKALPDVPLWATERALSLWRTPSSSSSLIPALLRQVQAVLTFDSWHAPVGVALRSRGMAPRQLLFSVGSHDIDLRVVSQAGDETASEICGQVLGPATSGGAVWLTLAPGTVAGSADASSSAETEFNESGEFVIPGPIGPHGVLRLRLGADIVDLPLFDLTHKAQHAP